MPPAHFDPGARTTKPRSLRSLPRAACPGFRERHRPIEERLAALVAEIARLQGEIDFLKIRTVMEEDIVS
jgi:hypothetical protein